MSKHFSGSDFDMEKINALPRKQNPDENEFEILCAIVESGPLTDFDDKEAIQKLVEMKLIAEIIVEGEEGYYAATPLGGAYYSNQFDSNKVSEAIIKRYDIKRAA